MLQQPLNYVPEFQGPMEAQQNFEAGQRQTQLQQALSQVAQNPTHGNFISAMTRFPELADKLKAPFDAMNKDRQQSALSAGSQIYAALASGNPAVAAQLSREQADAYRNGGDAEEAQHAETMAKMIETSPQAAKSMVGMSLASWMGPEHFAGTFSAFSKEDRESAAQPYDLAKARADAVKASAEAGVAPQSAAYEALGKEANVRNINSQIADRTDQASERRSAAADRAARLGLDADKFQAETELKLTELAQKGADIGPAGKKFVNDAVEKSIAAGQSVGKMLAVADSFEKLDASEGAFGKGAELWKTFWGSEDEVSELKKQYLRLKNTGVISSLPPGSASDADVSLAKQAFLSENANPKAIAAALRVMAAASRYESVSEDAKAEWVNSNGSLGKARKDMNINGASVPAGTTFSEFSKTAINALVEKNAAEQGAKQVQGRSYMRFAAPGGGGAR